jgi:hypothetical protein
MAKKIYRQKFIIENLNNRQKSIIQKTHNMKRHREEPKSLQELSTKQLENMRGFFKACHATSFGPWKGVDEKSGALKLQGYTEMPFEKYALEVLHDKRPVIMHLGIWGAQEGKTMTSHTGLVIARFFGESDIVHLFLDLLPFCVRRVNTFKQLDGDKCFETKDMSDSVLDAWKQCANVAGDLARTFLGMRRNMRLQTSMYGMGIGAQLWIKFAGLADVECGPHPSAARGHPGISSGLISSANKIRTKLGFPQTPDESFIVRKLVVQRGLDVEVAIKNLACAMHMQQDVVERVIKLGECFNLSKLEKSQLLGLRWWTHSVLQKCQDVSEKFNINMFLKNTSFLVLLGKRR